METALPAYKGYFDPNENRSKMIFGQGSLASLPDEVRAIGQRALLITGETINTKTDLVQRVSDLLGPMLIGVFAASAPHTPRSVILRAAAAARSLNPDVVISLGGGSHTDTAKAMRLALWQDVSDDAGFDRAYALYKKGWESNGDRARVSPLLPQIGLPTTLISAEQTQGVGVTDEKTHQKQVFSHPDLQSQVIILDPDLSLATPSTLWFSTGVKALEHAMAKLSALERDPVVDAIAAQAVRILGHELRRSWRNPAGLAARGNLLVGSWLCMFGSWQSLVKRMGLSHALGRQTGAVSGAPHGMISSVLLPFCVDYNAPVADEGLVAAARALGVESAGLTGEQAAHAAAEAIRALVAELKLPSRLRDIGVKESDLPRIAQQTMADMSTATNPRRVAGADEVLALLRQAW